MFSSLVLSRRPKIFKKRPKTLKKSPHSYRLMPGFTYAPLCYFLINGCPSCTKPHFFKKCAPLLHETFFREMCAPLVRNHTFCEKCVPPLAPNPTFLQKHRNPHAWIREQLSKSAHLPDQTHARTKYPVRGNPSLRCSKC